MIKWINRLFKKEEEPKKIEPKERKDHSLERFVDAQERMYEMALTEVKSGKKLSHWIWYIFPQLKGLGESFNSHYYGIDDLDEARKSAYPFIYKNQYTELYYIAEGLENPTNAGKITIPAVDSETEKGVLTLVFDILDIDFDATKMISNSSSMVSMVGDMSIFNEMIDNDEFIKSQYDLLSGNWVKYNESHADEAYLVLDANNELDDYVLYGLGLLDDTQMDKVLKGIVENKRVDDPIEFDTIIGRTYKVLDAVDYYVYDEGLDSYIDFRAYGQQYGADGKTLNPLFDYELYQTHYKNAYNNCTNEVKIVGIIRTNEVTKNGSLKTGVAYTKYFTEQIIDYRNAKIETFGDGFNAIKEVNKKIPATISLYIKSFESKDGVVAFIDGYNAQAENEDKITYTDVAGFIMSTVSTIINAITYVLIAFVSVSLIVSSIMIGIITYISVIERTKEIGVLRSVGASKRDVKRVFTAESFIIGLASGVLGIVVSLLLIIPINLILGHFTGISGLARLPLGGAIALILISVILTFISGLLPARAAAKKDPVIALREN